MSPAPPIEDPRAPRDGARRRIDALAALALFTAAVAVAVGVWWFVAEYGEATTPAGDAESVRVSTEMVPTPRTASSSTPARGDSLQPAAAKEVVTRHVAEAPSPATAGSDPTNDDEENLFIDVAVTDSTTGALIAEPAFLIRRTARNAFALDDAWFDRAPAVACAAGHRIGGLSPGTYALRVSAASHETVIRDSLRVIAGDAAPRIEIPMQPARVVRGRVVADETEAPIEGASIWLLQPAMHWIIDPRSPPVARTSSDGTYRVAVTDPGSFRLFAKLVNRSTAASEELNPPACRETDAPTIRLARGAIIRGEVLLASGVPADRVHVQASHESLVTFAATTRSVSTTTSENGAFELSGLAAGRWTVTVSPRTRIDPAIDAELRGVMETVALNAGDVVPLELRCVPNAGTTLVVTIRADGPPRPMSLQGRIEDVGDDRLDRWFMVDVANGECRIPNLAPGPLSWSVRVGRTSHAGRTIVSGEPEQRLHIELPPTGAVSGRVTRTRDGRAVWGATVMVTPEEAPSREAASAGLRSSGAATTDRDGRFQVPALLPGRYAVTAKYDGESDWKARLISTRAGPVEVVEGTEKAVDVSVDEGGLLDVFVGDRESNPVARALLTLSPEEPSTPDRREAQTDLRGMARIRGIVPGRYRLSVLGHAFAPLDRSVSVAAARTESLRVELDPGVTIRFVFRVPPSVAAAPATVFVVRNSDSRVQAGLRRLPTAPETAFEGEVRLRPGPNSLRAVVFFKGSFDAPQIQDLACEVSEGMTQPVEFVLDRLEPSNGRVRTFPR